MENTKTSSLIEQFRSARSVGLQVLRDYGGACAPAKKPFLLKPTPKAFLLRAKSCLETLYGTETPIVQRYRKATGSFLKITEEQWHVLFAEFEYTLNNLEFLSRQEPPNLRSRSSLPPSGKNVFIIHGHDEVNTLRLKDLLQDHFRLAPVLMMAQAGMSQALLKKFEDSASTCSLAFALITPDDLVTPDGKTVDHGDSYHQARPNVIFEVGWFVGRLEAPRVCLLLKEGTTVHSDIDGIARIQFKDNVKETVLDIQRELQAVGLLKA